VIASVVRVATASSRRWLPVFVTAYTVARLAAVAGELDDYGVDPVVFGLLDIGTAWPYGWALAVLGQSLHARRWRRATLVALASAPLAAAPYGYLLLGATGLPAALVAAICAIGIVSAAIGLWVVLCAPSRNADAQRRERDVRRPARGAPGSAASSLTGKAGITTRRNRLAPTGPLRKGETSRAR
jgi:hypothetical protein